MRKNAFLFDENTMRRQTLIASKRTKDLIERGYSAEADTHRSDRALLWLCKCCYYGAPVVAGQAITAQPCACCGKDQTYSSTRTDALCLDCALNGQLCKRCGGDIDMRIDRDEWPEPLFNQESQP